MRRFLLLLSVLLCLSVGAAAYEIPTDFTDLTPETVVAEFRDAYGLTEHNFSLSYYNTVTGETYAFNDAWFSIAASTYKLPLNMYFYEMQQTGEITGDTVITWTGLTLDQIHQKSIVDSNNEYSEALMYYWGDHTTYKENLRKYFTMTDEEISPLYWQANWFCTRMMMDCLRYLYANQDNFEELIGYMKQGMPDGYFKRGVTEYEVAHKYGAVQTYHNDVGIIYTPQPFLLAVYTQGLSENICCEAAKLLTAYTVWQAERMPEPEVPQEPVRQSLAVEILPVEQPEEPQPEESAPELPAEKTQNSEPVPAVPLQEKRTAVFPVAAAAVAAAVLVLWLLRKIRRVK